MDRDGAGNVEKERLPYSKVSKACGRGHSRGSVMLEPSPKREAAACSTLLDADREAGGSVCANARRASKAARHVRPNGADGHFSRDEVRAYFPLTSAPASGGTFRDAES